MVHIKFIIFLISYIHWDRGWEGFYKVDRPRLKCYIVADRPFNSQEIEKGILHVAINAQTDESSGSSKDGTSSKKQVKFEIYGEELIEKKVKASGNSGRVYLPPDWIDHHVKIVRID